MTSYLAHLCTSQFTLTLNRCFINFVAPTRLKNFCLTSHSIRNRHISSAFTFTGNQFLTYILKRMKVFYDRYETLLHIFTSDSVRQVLPKFLPLNCGRKITDFKEWSKIRVCCFFWQIKLGKNKEFWTQSNVVETNFTFQANAVWSQAKDFSSALARQNLWKNGSKWKGTQM